MVDVPFRPMNDHVVTILVFFAIFVGRRVPFFGHSLLSYSKRRHLSTSRVIPLIDCHQSLYHQHRILSTFLPDLCSYGRAINFNFWAVSSLLEYDQPLYIFFLSAFVLCGPVAQRVLSFPKNSRILPYRNKFCKSVLRHWVCLL